LCVLRVLLAAEAAAAKDWTAGSSVEPEVFAAPSTVSKAA